MAAAPLPALPPCDGQHFAQCLRIMIAALPRQNADETTAELFVAAYRRKLGHLPKDAINHMTDQALERCKWFPTIMECLSIVESWTRDDEHVRQRDRAIAAVRWEKQDRMEEIMTALDRGEATQAQVDAMPERWQSIAETRGLLRRLPEGGFVVRATIIAMGEVE